MTKIPSEGELIDMRRQFDELLEVAAELTRQAHDKREVGKTADAGALDEDAACLCESHRLAKELIDILRVCSAASKVAKAGGVQ